MIPNNPALIAFQCTVCGACHLPDSLDYTCPACGEAGTLDMIYDFEMLKRTVSRESITSSHDYTLWRYRELMPLAPGARVPPLAVGWSPLIDVTARAGDGLAKLWIKDDGRNPTGSLKDRASAMVVAHALHIGAHTVTTASTGNAAAALAGVAASAGIDAVIFVPKTAPEAKIAQLLVYGARVFLVDGNYDDAFDLCMQASARYGWYCRNTGINPYTTEGKKTVSYEICEQLGWRAPAVAIVSVGDGSIIGGVHKGFADLHALGWIDHIPRLIGVQADGSAACYQAWRDGSTGAAMDRIEAHTIADSIASDLPRDRVKAIRAVTSTGGAFVTVSDAETLRAIPHLAALTGVFMEPACAATWAGLATARAQGLIAPDEEVVVIGTGNGLKGIRGAMQAVGHGTLIGKTLADLAAAL